MTAELNDLAARAAESLAEEVTSTLPAALASERSLLKRALNLGWLHGYAAGVEDAVKSRDLLLKERA